MAFLSLPTELRFAIYSIIAIPDTAPFSAYHGLYMSCRQVKTEMDGECGKVLLEHLRQLQSTFQDQQYFLQLTVANTFPAMLHARLSFDSNIYTLSDVLNELVSLHLESLTLTPRRASFDSLPDMDVSAFFHWTLDALPGNINGLRPCMRRLIIETTVTSQSTAKLWTKYVERPVTGRYVSRWVLKSDRRLAAVWEVANEAKNAKRLKASEFFWAFQGRKPTKKDKGSTLYRYWVEG